MHLRVTRVRRAGKTYEYAQLVESVRVPGGTVTKKVIASLGTLTPLELDNIRASLDASRKGRHVHVGPPIAAPPRRPDASLDFLDLAVLLAVWKDAGLEDLVTRLFGEGQAILHDARVLTALVLHRCVAARSKLHAQRWLPSTALPELLEIPTDAFNNTRIHRVLERLHENTPALMRALPTLFGFPERPTAALFLDLTDTWFVGRGPETAQPGWTKEHLIRRKIGIALLCNDTGLPLRWEVVSGGSAEAPVMLDLLRREPLVRKMRRPVVADRALGSTAYIEQLLNADVPFLTALRRWEFARYAPELPTAGVASLPTPTADSLDALTPACKVVTDAGMERVADDLYLRDLGITAERTEERDDTAIPPPNPTEERAAKFARVLGAGRVALEVGRAIVADVAAGLAPSNNEAGRRRGLHVSTTRDRVALTKLAGSVQSEVLAQRAEHVSAVHLHALLKLPEADQLDALREQERHGRTSSHGGPWRPPRDVDGPVTSRSVEASGDVPRVRVIACFNPRLWREQREAADQRLDRVNQFVAELNEKLARPTAKRTEVQVRTAIARYLDRIGHVAAFDVEVARVTEDGRERFRAAIAPNSDWRRRRELDGFSLLVAHPDLTTPAHELARLYRAKDVIEKDFQIIKSLIRLRPVWHHNDDKVRAHVTLCMLALALERLLQERLPEATSTAAALETLAGCSLHRFHGSAPADELYVSTHPTSEQAALLKHLGLSHLPESAHIANAVTPRHLL